MKMDTSKAYYAMDAARERSLRAHRADAPMASSAVASFTASLEAFNEGKLLKCGFLAMRSLAFTDGICSAVYQHHFRLLFGDCEPVVSISLAECEA